MVNHDAAINDLAGFAAAIYGPDAVGNARWAVGVNGYCPNGPSSYKFREGDWREAGREFAYPSLTGKPYRDMLAAAAESDVYLCANLMRSGKRSKDSTTELRLIHADWDGDEEHLAECIEKIHAIGGSATMSGTPGHLQVYVRLARPVSVDRHKALTMKLQAYLPSGCDVGKKMPSDMLRPVGTLNHKGRARRLAGHDPDGQSTLVVWAIPSTGAAIDPDTLDRLLAPRQDADSQASQPRTATNGSTSTSGTGWPAGVQAALRNVSDPPDRSKDTARVVGACIDAGIESLDEIREIVNSRTDLAERLAEFFARNPPVDDVDEMFWKAFATRQQYKRECIAGQWFEPQAGGRSSENDSGAGDSSADAAETAGEHASDTLPNNVFQILPTLEGDFWQTRDSLKQIYQAALSRMASPWAVLACCAARALIHVRPNCELPPLVGGPGSLNWFAAIAAPSGGGKGSALAVAKELVNLYVYQRNLGSGEGLITAYQCKESLETPNGKRESVMFVADEIDSVAALGSRNGSTLMPTLRQAFSGEPLGFSYATKGRDIHLEAQSYRMAFVCSVQPGRAKAILGDVAGGTPQRFMWFPGIDPRIMRANASEDCIYKLDLPTLNSYMYPRTLKVPDEAREFILAERERINSGRADPIEGHATFAREKLAYALAVLDGRDEMTSEDWEFSGIAANVSDATRDWVAAELRQAEADEDAALGRRQGTRSSAAADEKLHQEQQRNNRIARWAEAKLKEAGSEGMLWNRLATAASKRDRAYLHEVLKALAAQGRVVCSLVDGAELWKLL
jgi:hypothetical protein